MKILYRILGVYGVIAVVFLSLRGLGILDIGIYEMILKWVNFGILAFAIVWFGREPIRNFLASQKEAMANEIDRLEEEKKTIHNELKNAEVALKESQASFDALKQRIIEQGEKKKAQIITDAEQRSAKMLEDVKRRIERMTAEAKASLAAEMIDEAIEMARNRLSEVVTQEDNQKYVDRYMAEITQR